MNKWIRLNEDNVKQLKVGDIIRFDRYIEKGPGYPDWYGNICEIKIGSTYEVKAINMCEKNIEVRLPGPSARYICCDFDRLGRFSMAVEEEIDDYSFDEIYDWLEPKVMKNIPEGKTIFINSVLKKIIVICYKAGYVRGMKGKSFKIETPKSNKSNDDIGKLEKVIVFLKDGSHVVGRYDNNSNNVYTISTNGLVAYWSNNNNYEAVYRLMSILSDDDAYNYDLFWVSSKAKLCNYYLTAYLHGYPEMPFGLKLIKKGKNVS